MLKDALLKNFDMTERGKPEIKCGICGKGHLTIRCYKNPDRKQATVRKSLAEVAEIAEEREVILIRA